MAERKRVQIHRETLHLHDASLQSTARCKSTVYSTMQVYSLQHDASLQSTARCKKKDSLDGLTHGRLAMISHFKLFQYCHVMQ